MLIALVADDDDEAKAQRNRQSAYGELGGRPSPSHAALPRRVEVQLWDLSVRHELYGKGQSHSWRLAVSIHDAEVGGFFIFLAQTSSESSYLLSARAPLWAVLVFLAFPCVVLLNQTAPCILDRPNTRGHNLPNTLCCYHLEAEIEAEIIAW